MLYTCGGCTSFRTHRIALTSGADLPTSSQLEELILFDPDLHNEMAIDTCVDNFSGSILNALAVLTPKRRRRDDSRPPIPAGIQD